MVDRTKPKELIDDDAIIDEDEEPIEDVVELIERVDKLKDDGW